MKSTSLLPLLGALLATISATGETADQIYHNGTILTISDVYPRAEAVAVKDGRILAVGDQEAVLETRGRRTEVIDLEGRTLLPGFVDAHGHVMAGGLQALSANLLAPPDGEVRDIAGLQETLRDWIAANREAVDKVQLIIGFGYDNSQLAELRHPTRDDLDAVSEETPILIIHQSGHLGVGNSIALEAAGISAQTVNPEGGVIQRRPGGQEPNGVLEETALIPVMMKLLSRVGPEAADTFVQAGTELWARFGYTTAQEGRSTPGVVQVLQAAAEAGDLKVDVVAYVDVLSDRELIRSSVSPEYTHHFRVAGAKLTIDGSPQGFTAWRDRPYYKPVGDYPPGYAGYPAASTQMVGDAIDWAFANNIQLLTHSNGEAASDQLIAFIRAAAAQHGNHNRRPVLIHGQFLREDQMDALKALGVIPSLFPMHTFYWGDWHREHTIGPELADDISPTGWCVTRNMIFTSHHDAPVAFPDSMRVLDATVTRRSRTGDIIGPAHRMDVLTALKAMTLWPAYQHFEEDTKGSIEVGKLADFVILDQDPTAIDPEQLDQIRVVQTIKEGVTIYSAAVVEAAGFRFQPDSGTSLVFSRTLRGIAEHLDHDASHDPGHGHASSCLCGTMSRLASLVAGEGP